MKIQYLIRLDDACPTMNKKLWDRMENLLDLNGIKPLVGIIPHNEDPKQMIEPENYEFWSGVKRWEEKGWAIALHGYNHVYKSNDGLEGLNPLWMRSEFASVPLEDQRKKIREGMSIMHEHRITPKYFFAPSHTFDENTLKALREESDIRIISDTIGRWPYKKGEFWFIPQIAGHCVKMPFGGIYTFCFHPNTMSDVAYQNLELFLKKYNSQFICFDNIDLSLYGGKLIMDKMISWAFFTMRKLRGLK